MARKALCVEYSPYCSYRCGSRVPLLPPQEFSLEHVRAAIDRDAVIVVMRAGRRWEAAVPELAGYRHRFTLRNVQNVSVSPRNCPGGYCEILKAIQVGDEGARQSKLFTPLGSSSR